MSYIKRLFVDGSQTYMTMVRNLSTQLRYYLYQKKMCELLQMNLNYNEMRES